MLVTFNTSANTTLVATNFFKTQTKYVTVRCCSHFPQEGRVRCLALATSSGRMNGVEQKSIKIRNGTVDTWPVLNFQQPIFTSHHGDAKQFQWWAKLRPYHGVKVFPVSFDKSVPRLCLEFQVPKTSFIRLPTPPFHDVTVRVFWCVQCRVKATTYFWIIFFATISTYRTAMLTRTSSRTRGKRSKKTTFTVLAFVPMK